MSNGIPFNSAKRKVHMKHAKGASELEAPLYEGNIRFVVLSGFLFSFWFSCVLPTIDICTTQCKADLLKGTRRCVVQHAKM